MIVGDETTFWTHPLTIALSPVLATLVLGLLTWIVKELRLLRLDLVRHMGTEESVNAADKAERVAVKQVHDERFGRLEGEVSGLKDSTAQGFSRVHERLDRLLESQAAATVGGHPGDN